MSSDHRAVVTVASFLPVPKLSHLCLNFPFHSKTRTDHIQGAAILEYLKLRSKAWLQMLI